MSTSRMVALLPLLLAACQGAKAPVPSSGAGPFAASQPAARVASPETGRRLYAALCSSCHGADGRGDTALGRELDPPAADLTACNFKYRSTPSGSLPTDADLLRALYVGLPGTSMPSLADRVSLPALRALVAQVKARCRRFAEERPEPALPRPKNPVAYSAASVARGRVIYREQKCANCHGEEGRGDGPAAATLKDLQGKPARPRVHADGVFRSGFRRRDIYRAFSTGLDGTPMPALTATGLDEASRWDLANFIVSLSHGRSRVWRFLGQRPTWYEPAASWGLQTR